MIEEQHPNYLSMLPAALNARIGDYLPLKEQTFLIKMVQKTPLYEPDDVKSLNPLAALALNQNGTLLQLTRIARNETSPLSSYSREVWNDLNNPETERRIKEDLKTLPDNNQGRKVIANLIEQRKSFPEMMLADIPKLDSVQRMLLYHHPEAKDEILADFACHATSREERRMLEQHPNSGPLTKISLASTASRPEIVVENILRLKACISSMARATSITVMQQALRNWFR